MTARDQNNETAAMLVFQTNPVGVELFSHVSTFFGSNRNVSWLLAKFAENVVLGHNNGRQNLEKQNNHVSNDENFFFR